ncbi:fimbria/pilus outer membrane usher protein [Mixta tenebrionis]|uniref:Fimbrial biogenesis outer membrane usher protein n=1 Tax=Mixta tenebrionis TaxID=2562439 RepID=A0A506V5L0_9GAMM|nr:fimbria/pilus outer membrane usher protein [Mixta tenebrionis]TPW40958.1 fimbrial biogenesis outer membrane usher protein [Mixta tenebrionis]
MKFWSLTFLILIFAYCHSANAGQQLWVIVNNNYKGQIFLEMDGEEPCLQRDLLEEWGVKLKQLPEDSWSAQGCLTQASLELLRIQSWYRPDAGLLTILIPDKFINARQNGVNTSRWDEGINAFFTSYRASYTNYQSDSPYAETGDSYNVEFDNGINYGPWRLRYQNTLWRDAEGRHGIYSRQANLYRSINSWRSQLLAGDGETTDTLFDAVPFRGITLVTDEAMFPDSWRPFSPWINGYARSHAEVTISQNGMTVYRIHVPPGPFVIRDFYPPDNNGTLQLTVKESDGSESSRYLPWSAMPALVHEGNYSYELVAGRYRPWRGSDLAKPTFLQASLARGITPALTLYTGAQHADQYDSYLAGAGLHLNALGSFSMDTTWARYTSYAEDYRGSVWRLRYARTFFNSGTNFSALLRYYPAGQQFRSLEEKVTQPSAEYDWLFDENKNRLLTQEYWINHYLNEEQSLSLHYTQQNWRKTPGHRRYISLSYQANVGDWDISVWLGRSREQSSRSETTLGVTLSLALPDIPGGGSPSLSYSHNLASHSDPSEEIGLSGTALSDYSLRYDLSAVHTPHADNQYNASLGYQYDAGEATVSAYREGGTRERRIDMRGSVLVHRNGITLGQEVSDTMALIVVPDTPGIGNYQQFGVKTNAKGEALVGYLVPWRVNRLTLDSWQLPDDLTLPMTERGVVPTKGAIVRAMFLPAEKKKVKDEAKAAEEDEDEDEEDKPE